MDRRTTDLATRDQGSIRDRPARLPVNERIPLVVRVLLAAGLTMGVLSASAGTAAAHFEDQAYLYLDVTPDDLQGQVQMPSSALREVFDLRLDGSNADNLAELQAHLPTLHGYLEAHTTIGTADTAWPLDFEGVELLGEAGFIVFPFTTSVPDARVPREIVVRFDALLDELDDGRTTLVLLRNDWQRGVFSAEANTLEVFDRSRREATIDLGDASQWRNFTASIPLGIDHIRTGLDHVAFVIALLLPAVLLGSHVSRPAPTFSRAFWRILKIATMFTLAHSITFTLAGLDLLPLPSPRVVETVIALSIAAAAVHNIRPVLNGREWLIAFVFGLFHGMGFASLVNTIDIDRATRLYSLIGRNIGIEIGQVVIIVLAFPALFLLRRTRFYRSILVSGSVLLLIISILWVIERVADLDLRTRMISNRFGGAPTAALVGVAVVATVAAAWVERVERRAGRLLPVTSGTGSEYSPTDDRPVETLVN